MFESYIEVREANGFVKVILFTEFVTKEGERQVENCTDLAEYDTMKEAKNFVKWYEDNGAKVEYVTCSGMSPNDDEQYF